MNTPRRAVLSALAGATMLLVASCTSSAPESAPSSTASVTPSAWVKPLTTAETASGQSQTELPDVAVQPSIASSTGVSVSAGAARTGLVSVLPFPSELTPAESAQARDALEAFRIYWALTDDLAANPARDWSTEVSAASTGTAADFLQQSITQLREGGWTGAGQTSVQVSVARVQAGTVDLTTCVDVSNHDFTNQDGVSYKSKKDPGALSQFRGAGQVGQYESGWKVNSYTSYPTETC